LPFLHIETPPLMFLGPLQTPGVGIKNPGGQIDQVRFHKYQ